MGEFKKIIAIQGDRDITFRLFLTLLTQINDTLKSKKKLLSKDILKLRRLCECCKAKDLFKLIDPNSDKIRAFYDGMHMPHVAHKQLCLEGIETAAQLGIHCLVLKDTSRALTDPSKRAALAAVDAARQDPDETGTVDAQLSIFYPGLNLEALKKEMSHARQIEMDAFIVTLGQAAMGLHTDELILPAFYPQPTDFSPDSKTILNMLSHIMAAPEHEVVAQYMQIVTHTLGIKLSPHLFLALIPTGDTGATLVSKIETRISNGAVKAALVTFVSRLMEREESSGDVEKVRFQSAQKRVGEAVEQLSGKSTWTALEADNICRYISENIRALEFECSVGYDLQLIFFKTEISLILERESLPKQTKKDVLNAKFVDWVINRMRIALQINGVHETWVGDVHHLNYAAKLVLDHLGEAVPAALGDVYILAEQERMDRYKSQIVATILRPDDAITQMVSAETDRFSVGLDQCLQTGYMSASGQPDLTLEQLQGIVKELLDLDERLLGQFLGESNIALTRLDELLKRKGLSHGLLGELARAGNTDKFMALKSLFWSKGQPNLLKKDSVGMSLLDYAVLGGSVGILESFGLSEGEVFAEMQAYMPRTLPNLVGMASESGSLEMLNLIVSDIPAGEEWTYLTQADTTGHTPLMRAIMSKNTVMVNTMIRYIRDSGSEDALVDHVNDFNVYDQTALILSAVHGQGESVGSLLASGADPNYCMPRTLEEECSLDFIRIAALNKDVGFILQSISALKTHELIGSFHDNLHFLAEYQGDVCVDVLIGGDQADILPMLNNNADDPFYSIAHILGSHAPQAFVKLMRHITDPDLKTNILSIRDDYRRSLGDFLIAENLDIFNAIIETFTLEEKWALVKKNIVLYNQFIIDSMLKVISLSDRMKLKDFILTLDLSDKRRLLQDFSGDETGFKEMLLICTFEEKFAFLSEKERSERKTIAHNLAERRHGFLLKDILDSCTFEEKIQILSLKGPFTVAAHLVLNLDQLKAILLGCKTCEERRQILRIKDKYSDTFEAWMSEKIPTQLPEILALVESKESETKEE